MAHLLRISRHIVVYLAIIFFFLVYSPFLVDFEPVAYRLPLPKFEGPLAQNRLLSEAAHLLEGQVVGPESIATWKGNVYTGLADGRIIRLNGLNGADDGFVVVAHVTDAKRLPCNVRDIRACGRPLGMRFDSSGHLLVLDAYNGIKQVNVTTGEVTTVFSTRSKATIPGRPVIFIDDMVFADGHGAKGGRVYYVTDSSAKWELEFVNLIVFEHESSGRILKYDTDTEQTTVLAEKIGFPNGIELSDDQDSVLYNELNLRRTVRLYVRGPKSGQSEIFADNLPGEPDNIRRSASQAETYWVGLYEGKDSTRSNQDPLIDGLSETPTIRKALIKFAYHLGDALMYLGRLLEYVPLQDIGFQIRAGYSYQTYFKPYGLVVELNKNGQIIRSLHSPDGHTTHIAEVREVVENGKNVLYIGSYFNSFLGRLVLN